MANTTNEFDFDAGMTDGGYDPLEDIITQEEKDQDPGEFTGAPMRGARLALPALLPGQGYPPGSELVRR